MTETTDPKTSIGNTEARPSEVAAPCDCSVPAVELLRAAAKIGERAAKLIRDRTPESAKPPWRGWNYRILEASRSIEQVASEMEQAPNAKVDAPSGAWSAE